MHEGRSHKLRPLLFSPNDSEPQLAIRAILNALIGPGEFDRLCLGMRVECVEDGILYVFVPNEDCAAKIEANYSDDLAVAAEQVFSQPIRIVTCCRWTFCRT